MKKNRHINSQHFSTYVVATLLLVTVPGCNKNRLCNTGPLWSVPNPNAPKVHRQVLEEGLAKNQSLANHLSLLLSRFKTIPPLDLVLNEPPILPSETVSASDLAPYLGDYNEATLGQFDFNAGGDIVSLTFLNGVRIEMTALVYDKNGDLVEYHLNVTSNNGVDTPSDNEVTMNLQERRVNLRGIVLPGTEYRGTSLTGTIGFTTNGVWSMYEIERGIGSYQEQIFINSLEHGEKYHISKVNSNDYWFLDRNITYTPSDVSDIWVALRGNESYADRKIRYSIQFGLDGNNTVGGQAHFVDKGGYSCLYGYDMATVIGGPYRCDITSSSNTGSGVPIQMSYVDGVDTDIFPGFVFNCPRIKIPDPTL